MSTSGVCIVLDWIAALRWELVSLAYTAALPGKPYCDDVWWLCSGVWWANPIVDYLFVFAFQAYLILIAQQHTHNDIYIKKTGIRYRPLRIRTQAPISWLNNIPWYTMHIECVWWFSSSWRLRYWHPHQQHQLRAPRRQPTMAFFCHLETTMKLPWWSMMPYAWLLKSTRCVLQPCVGYQVICRRCCRKRSLDGSDSSKRTGVSGEDGFHVQCHLSTITILQGIVYVFLYIWWYSMPTVHSNHLPGQVSNVSTRFNMI